MRFYREKCGFPTPFNTLCDKSFVKAVLGHPVLESVVRKIRKRLGAEVNLAITICTAQSLMEVKDKLPDGFLLERCGYNPPISDVDCVVQRAINKEASKILLATSSDDVLAKIRYTPGLPVLYAKSENDLRLFGPTDKERMSLEENQLESDESLGRKHKNQLKRDTKMVKRAERDEEKKRLKKADRNELESDESMGRKHKNQLKRDTKMVKRAERDEEKKS